MKDNDLLSNLEKIDFTKLAFEPFSKNTKKVEDFNCGNDDLNEFLNTEEARKYEREKLGKTTTVYYYGKLVAYFTVSNYLLKKVKLKNAKNFSKLSEYQIEGYPSILIGRLAVQKEWQKHGIGRFLVSKIIKNALKSSEHFGIRLVVVQAKKDAFKVYEKLGFQYVEHSSEEKRFRARGTKTMFFDLKSLK